jgi:hypothetical protein
MCTGLEVALIAGGTAAASKTIMGGKPSTPAVVRESPVADQAKIDAEASVKANQDSTLRKRRIRASSLLATGGQGDTTAPVTGSVSAKPTLGA